MTYADKREKIPAGLSLAEYGERILAKMPTATLTYRETWALKQYFEQMRVLAGVCTPNAATHPTRSEDVD